MSIFCVGLRTEEGNLPQRQRSHCQAKLNFLTKERTVVSDEPGRGWLVGAGPGIAWQSLTEETDNSSLHFTIAEKS